MLVPSGIDRAQGGGCDARGKIAGAAVQLLALGEPLSRQVGDGLVKGTVIAHAIARTRARARETILQRQQG